MRAFITGGAGFVGSHLAEILLDDGYEVTILDDLSTGSMANIRHLKPDPRFQYVIDTVMNRSLLSELVDQSDIVFHLAAAVGVRLIMESPVRTIHTNVRATELVLEAAAKKRRKCSSLPRPKFTENPPSCLLARTTTWSSDLPCAVAGAMPVPKRLMSFLPSRTGASAMYPA